MTPLTLYTISPPPHNPSSLPHYRLYLTLFSPMYFIYPHKSLLFSSPLYPSHHLTLYFILTYPSLPHFIPLLVFSDLMSVSASSQYVLIVSPNSNNSFL